MIKSFRLDDKQNVFKNKLIRYHYTSANALLSILTPDKDGNNFLRFTDIRFMNDKSEKLYFVKILLEYMNDNFKRFPFSHEVINELLLKNHTSDEYIQFKVQKIDYSEEEYWSKYTEARNFIFCTSDSSDSLHMWNYYVHNGNYQGYNIGFNIYGFLKSFDTNGKVIDPIIVHYGKVIYKKSEQLREIENFLLEIEKYDDEFSPDYMSALISMRRYIDSKGVFFKDESFSQEKEYRIVFEIAEARLMNDRSGYFNEYNQKVALDFYERNGIIVPYLKVPFPKDCIKQITMSPIMEHSIAEESIKEFLTLYKYEDVNVEKSSVPIRY